jgi:hypothetical protein
MREKPCDGFCTPPLPTYLIIKFDSIFYFIRFERILEMIKAGRVSIKLVEANNIAEKIVKLKA